MDKSIKVGAVSYLNTKPLLYGLHNGSEVAHMKLIEQYPAKIAELLLADKIDVGLVPVAVLPQLNEYHIITDYCIGAVGPVASVAIFSEVPLAQVERVLLDYQSRTSVALARILLRDFWKINPILEPASPDFRSHINGTTAAVVIGDRAFEQRRQSKYVYDLAEAWVAMTGMPFVFAAWVANKKLPPLFIREFNEANRMGLQMMNEVVADNPFHLYNLHTYYTQNISYQLTPDKLKGLERFLEYLQVEQPLSIG